MVSEGCQYAVIETSSEGILQYRHRFIDYLVAVFTNLSPEHIERHGSFEKYREAKEKLFEAVARKKDGIGVYNLDDENVEYFLKCSNKIGFAQGDKCQVNSRYQISDIRLFRDHTEFSLNNERFEMPLIGEFNIQNAAAAICVAQSQGIGMEKIKEILKNIKPTPGRLEVINEGQPFTVIVDYAHEPASLEAVYKTLKIFNPKKIIAVLGAQGGGRDKAKRPILGEIAGRYADYIIVTNEDPYDENPQQIIDDVKKGISPRLRSGQNLYEILDRREAIRKALTLAQVGDIVIITGKGGEVWMCVADGKKISWDEREIV
jgi:UDP-N-acetylmuramyl-tripeptide synthetase